MQWNNRNNEEITITEAFDIINEVLWHPDANLRTREKAAELGDEIVSGNSCARMTYEPSTITLGV